MCSRLLVVMTNRGLLPARTHTHSQAHIHLYSYMQIERSVHGCGKKVVHRTLHHHWPRFVAMAVETNLAPIPSGRQCNVEQIPRGSEISYLLIFSLLFVSLRLFIQSPV